ncbi:hypothetical protein A9R01_11480 ['Osedax' symbiont bacterium Rs2_46_30_T18]|nr:hypothetical protein A9R01_11480 ['Osedax' symbiont bacterium Rs2_46_30_T18]
MTEKDFFSQLEHLSIAQLGRLHESLIEKINKAKEKSLSAAVLPGKALPSIPSNTAKVSDMADSLGLDLSSLMREIARH